MAKTDASKKSKKRSAEEVLEGQPAKKGFTLETAVAGYQELSQAKPLVDLSGHGGNKEIWLMQIPKQLALSNMQGITLKLDDKSEEEFATLSDPASGQAYVVAQEAAEYSQQFCVVCPASSSGRVQALPVTRRLTVLKKVDEEQTAQPQQLNTTLDDSDEDEDAIGARAGPSSAIKAKAVVSSEGKEGKKKENADEDEGKDKSKKDKSKKSKKEKKEKKKDKKEKKEKKEKKKEKKDKKKKKADSSSSDDSDSD